MYVYVAPRISIHFREIFYQAFTDGVTFFFNMWLCSRQALIFALLISTILQSDVYNHLKPKLFESMIMPVEVFISILKD